MSAVLPYGRHHIGPSDVEAVLAALRSDHLTQGPALDAFERALAGRCGARHAVAVNSATSALHLACLALELGPGDLLWTTPNTFVASANCARYCGADVGFVDIDPVTYNLCPDALETKLRRAALAGARLPKVVVPVHFAGQPCDMAAIASLAERYGFRVIEDASHAIGARYRDRPVGDCAYSDVTVFSFHPVKVVTSAEGGAALTDRPELAERMTRLRAHGLRRAAIHGGRVCADGRDDGVIGARGRVSPATGASDDPAHRAAHGGTAPDPWVYEQHELGFNYRLSDLHASLGLSQLARLDDFVARRHALARRYDERLAGLELTLPARPAEDRSALHLYPVLVAAAPGEPDATVAARRRRVFDALRAEGIGVNVHYIPVHTQPYYRALGHAPGDCPEAERYYRRTISLPLFAALRVEQQDRVIDALGRALEVALAA